MIGKSCAVVSGKGGVGKSMLVVALGALWAARGKNVLLVDMNTGMRGLDMLLGLENRIVFDLGDVLDGICEPRQAILRDAQTGIRLLAARQISDSEALDEDAFSVLIEDFQRTYDHVLLDAATGIGRGFSAAVRAAESALLIATPDDQSLRDADRASGLVQRLDRPPPCLVLNRLRRDFVEEGLQYEPEVCAQVLDLPVCGAIPEDDEIWRHTLRKQPAVGDFNAALSIQNLAERLFDRSIPLRPWRGEEKAAEEEKRGLFGKLRRAPREAEA